MIGKYFAIADSGELDAERAMMGIMHFSLNLYPFVLKIRKREIVYQNSFTRCPCISRMDYLYAFIITVLITACTDGDEWCTIVSLLRF